MKEEFYLTKKLPPYIFSAIYDLKEKAKAKGLEIIDFGMGNPDSAPPKHVIDKLTELSKDGSMFGYSVVGGVDALRKASASYYKRRFGVELDYQKNCLVTIGAKEGIASLATAISSSEDYVVVASPYYPIHKFAFEIAKTEIREIAAISGQEFLTKFKHLVNSEEKNPVAVIVCFPSNPTSENVGLDFYEEMVDFCKKKGIYIISDIAYSELYFEEEKKPHSILEVTGAMDIAIEFSSTSKSYSMAGCRVGFATGNEHLINALYKIKSYLDYGSFNPLQLAAVEALSEKSSDYLDSLRQKYKQRAEFLVSIFKQELDWELTMPSASMFCWAKLPKQFSNMTSFNFCKKLIEDAGVVFSPGSSFGVNGEGYVRISLIHDKENVIKAVEKLKKLF